jgi:hypothetical protein
MLFVVTAVQGPMLAIDLIEFVANGFPLAQSAAAAGSRAVYLLVGFGLPLLSLASLRRSLLEFSDGAVGVSFALAMLTIVFCHSPLYNVTPSSGVVWTTESVCLALGARARRNSLGVTIQYFRRKTLAALSLAGITPVLCLLTGFMPWRLPFAIQQRRSPSPGSARFIRIAFDPGRDRPAPIGRVSIGTPDQRGRYSGNVLVYLPLCVEGLLDDTVLKSDRSEVRLIGPNGMAVNLLGCGRFPEQLPEPASRWLYQSHGERLPRGAGASSLWPPLNLLLLAMRKLVGGGGVSRRVSHQGSTQQRPPV